MDDYVCFYCYFMNDLVTVSRSALCVSYVCFSEGGRGWWGGGGGYISPGVCSSREGIQLA